MLELDDHPGEVWQVAFSHDGKRLASSGSDKQVIIWDVPSFRVHRILKDHEAGVGNIAWSWDDSMLVTCSQDRYARLWDADVSDGPLGILKAVPANFAQARLAPEET